MKEWQSREIRKWLIDIGKSQSDIARDLGRTRQLVQMTIGGPQRNKKVLRWLREHGCPEEFLADELRQAA
jgi:hypothetical protein